MSRIMVAFGPGDITTALREGLSPEKIWGAKILMNERYKRSSETKGSKKASQSYNHIGACVLVRNKLVDNVILDTKLSDDIESEMVDSISTILEEDASNSPSKERAKKPNYFTAQYLLPKKALVAFVSEVTEAGIKPIISYPTSRFTDNDLKRIAGDIDRSVAEAAVLCQDMGAMLMLGAIDASVAKKAAPEVKIIGFGGCLDEKELGITSHVRPALIAEAAPYVDVFGFGTSIFGSKDINQAVNDRDTAITAAQSVVPSY